MKAKFIITTTAIDQIDPDDEDFGAELEHVQAFASEAKAKSAFKRFIKRTNMDVYLLRVEEIEHGEGTV